MYGIRAVESCRARHHSIWQRERDTVPIRGRCEAQADEARPSITIRSFGRSGGRHGDPP